VSGSGLALFCEATVRTATPLALAALGETVAERSGVINLGAEGAIIGGAFGALVGASASGVAGGLVVGIASGALIGALFAMVVVWWRVDQIIAGTAISLLALGATGTLYRTMFGAGGAALSIPTLHPAPIPGLEAIPIVGVALFAQPVTTYALYAAAIIVWWWLRSTHSGLALRACGESPDAARGAGISVSRMRWGALIFAGSMGGLAGAVLVLAQAGTFADGMSAGRGFVAIAIVVLGGWHPLRVVAAAALFGAASALQTLLQTVAPGVPYQFFLALPYVVTIGAMARVSHRVSGRARAPDALGVSDAA